MQRASRRAPAAAPARSGGRTGRGGNAAADDQWMKRGNTARDQSEFEQEEAKKRAEKRKQGSAYRFFLPRGEDASVIVLDYSFEEVPFFYEHNIQAPDGKWNIFEPCVKEFAECPICQGHGQRGGDPKPSYYAMFLTVLDTRGFVTKDNEEVPYDRKLLVVKQGQHQEFFRLFDAATKQYGTLRGLELLLAREDSTNASAIGKPVVMDDGQMFIVNSEEDLLEDFGHDPITDSNGKVIMEADALLAPFDYTKLFPRPDADALRRKYGAAPTAGSRDDMGEDGWEDEPAAGGRGRSRGGRAAPAEQVPARGGARRGRAAPAEEEEYEEEELPQEPARGRRTGRAAPAQQESRAPARTTRSAGRAAPQQQAPASAGRRGGRGPIRGGDSF